MPVGCPRTAIPSFEKTSNVEWNLTKCTRMEVAHRYLLNPCQTKSILVSAPFEQIISSYHGLSTNPQRVRTQQHPKKIHVQSKMACTKKQRENGSKARSMDRSASEKPSKAEIRAITSSDAKAAAMHDAHKNHVRHQRPEKLTGARISSYPHSLPSVSSASLPPVPWMCQLSSS